MSNCINLFALHYFLWFAAISSIYGFISVYAQHYANSTSSQYGLLNMILPFVTIGSKLIFCSLADRYRAYRAFFITFLVSALLGYGSFAVLPFLVTPPAKDSGTNQLTFAAICVMTSVATISMSVLSCLSDAFAMNSSRKYNTNYGMIRLWGTLGWGASAFFLAFINQYDKLPYLVPGVIMTIVLISIDISAVVTWKNRDDFNLDKSASDKTCEDVLSVLAAKGTSSDLKDESVYLSASDKSIKAVSSGYGTSCSVTKDKTVSIEASGNENAQNSIDISSLKMQWILFKQVSLLRPSIFHYMTLFTISGGLISLQWSYFFLYLEKIYEADFTFISGLSMVGQSMLGELPFFVLSNYIIQLLGRSHSLSISIASIGLRYLLYNYLLPNHSMYFVLLTETFQGPNFGLFYVVMTEVGLDYSDCEEVIANVVAQGVIANDPEVIDKLRQALRATMQSVMSACYEGLGVGIGSIVGGLTIDHFGYESLWFYSSLTAIALGLFNMFYELAGRKSNNGRL